MDAKEINNAIVTFLQRQEDIYLEFDKDIKDTAERLHKILFSPIPELHSVSNNNDKTPKQIKKRTKRLSVIQDMDTEETVNDSCSSNNDSKKIDEYVTVTDGMSRRPHRAAKSNLDFKEVAVNRKMRRPSDSSDKDNDHKMKDNSNNSITNKSIKKSAKTEKKIKKELIEGFLSKKVAEDLMEVDQGPIDKESKTSEDVSLVIVEKKSKNIIIDIQDSENENEVMPPPQALPLKKNLRSKKKSSESIEIDNSKSKFEDNKSSIDVEQCFKEVKVKLEKLSIELPTKLKKKKSKGKKKPIPLPIKEERISSENIESTAYSKRITRSNRTNQTEVPSANEVSSSNNNNNTLESVYEDAIPLQEQNNNQNTNKTSLTKEKNTQEIGLMVDNKSPIADATFVSAKDVAHNIAVTMANETFVTQSNYISAQSTFIMTGNQNQNINDATITINETQCVNKQFSNGDTTFNVPEPPDSNAYPEKQEFRDSIMTEEDSDNDIPLVKYKPKPKSHLNRKELFNPCVQSPVKKKVEAFEQQVFHIKTPIPQRQTRTKTRAQKAQETETTEKDDKTENKNLKPFKEKNITPLIGRQIARLLTPAQHSNITPKMGGISVTMPNSTSKLIGIHKKLQPSVSKTSLVSTSSSSSLSTGTGRTPLHSRENSVEDLKRLAAAQTEERKKKNKLKQQQAQQARERQEKERNEHFKKMLEEREEKAKRKAAEAEQRRQIDEIQRQLKLQDEKIEQQKRIEKQKAAEIARREREAAELARKERETAEIARLEREAAEFARRERETAEIARKAREVEAARKKHELAEIARKEREMLENLKIQKAKEKMQLKFEQNKKQLNHQKLNDTSSSNGPKYDFDMLESDDSTDDEGTTKDNRPPIPQWSTNSVRQILIDRQANVPTKIIDGFFSVQPLTPDLSEIFPNIDRRYLKRNSSVIWKTPPRYSQLPQHF